MAVRVLQVITRLIVGGAQETTMQIADRLKHDPAYERRYQVEMISGPQTGSEGSLIEEVRSRGVRLTILPELRREISPIKDLKALRELFRMMTASSGGPRFDIVHTHSSKSGVLGRIAAKLAGVPIIIHTVHGWSFHSHMSIPAFYSYIALEKIAARYCQKMISVSNRDVSKGLARGIGQPNKYVVIRSGIELDRFGHSKVPPEEMRKTLGIPVEALVVGSVTRLSPPKTPLYLAEAFSQILAERPESWFVIVGDGPQRSVVEQRLHELGIADRTIMTGLRRDVPELMATFDVFVFSSLWEGLPRVLPQAMATGLPIVGTDVGAASEAVRDSVNGFLVDYKDPSEMSAKAITLLDNPTLRSQMAAEGRHLAGEFDENTMVTKTESLYRRLLGSIGYLI